MSISVNLASQRYPKYFKIKSKIQNIASGTRLHSDDHVVPYIAFGANTDMVITTSLDPDFDPLPSTYPFQPPGLLE